MIKIFKAMLALVFAIPFVSGLAAVSYAEHPSEHPKAAASEHPAHEADDEDSEDSEESEESEDAEDSEDGEESEHPSEHPAEHPANAH